MFLHCKYTTQGDYECVPQQTLNPDKYDKEKKKLKTYPRKKRC